MTVGPIGSAIICCEDSFIDFCKEVGLRNPFRVELNNMQRVERMINIKGVEVKAYSYKEVENPILFEPDEKERFNNIKNKFFAAWILVNCGYDILCQTKYINYIDGLRPCQGLERQCSLDCECYSNKCSIGRFEQENPQIWRFIINECKDDA